MRRARRGVAQSTGFSRETQFRPPLPGEALDWPHEHWVRAAFSCGCRLSHRNREIGAASRTAESLRARRRDTPTAPALYQKRATAETARLRGVEAAPRAAQSHVRHFMWRRRRPRELRHLRGQRRRRRRQAAADARGFIKEAGLVGVRAQVRGRGHHGRASIRVPVSVPSHRPRNTQVASLAELSEEELDKFDMRKLEKRKLRHHLQSAWVPDGVALRC